MSVIFEHPLFVFATAGITLWLSAWFGTIVRKWSPLDQEMRLDFTLLLSAALTLIALIIGFSFSMASSRYEQRKNYEESEANAIGTEYLRATLLPASDKAIVRALLKSYLAQRVLFYTSRDDQEIEQVNARTALLQTQLWSAILGPAAATPTPIVGLAVSGMNDVLNSQSYTQAAFWYRVPPSACLMGLIALGCNLLVGYGLHSRSTASRLLFVFPLFMSIAFAFIADIDSPRHGIIRIHPQNLLALARSLPAS